MRELGEGIGYSIPGEGLRRQDRRHGSGLARDFAQQASDVVGSEARRGVGREQSHIVIGVVTAEPFEDAEPRDLGHLERPQKEQVSVRRMPYDDDGIVTLRPEHVTHPSLGPVIGLRRRARRDRLQRFPFRLDACKVVGDAERNPPQARIHQDWAAPFNSASRNFGLGAEKGSGAHTRTASFMLLLDPLNPDPERQSFCKEPPSQWGCRSRQWQSRVNG